MFKLLQFNNEKSLLSRRVTLAGLSLALAANVLVALPTQSFANESSDQKVESSADEKDKKSNEREIVVGKPVKIGNDTLTITDLSLGTDFEGKDALIITYDFENGSKEAVTPTFQIHFKGYQDGVQTDDLFMVDGVDLGIGQKEIKPGAKITDAQAVVGITDLSKPLLLEVDELISFTSKPYSLEVDLSKLK